MAETWWRKIREMTECQMEWWGPKKPKRPSWKRLARNVMLDKKDTSSIADKRKYGVESKRDYDSCTLDKTGSKRAMNVDITFDNAQIDVGLLGNLEFYSTPFILGPDYKVSIEVNGKERCKKMGIKWTKVRRRSFGFLEDIYVSTMGSRGRLYMAWRKNVSISLITYSGNYIDAEVEEIDELWQDHIFPWLVCGDFKEIIYAFKKLGQEEFTRD
ncbi:hypothetical protein GOBAR_AA00906 [Gossypium barbadense]|uniref:Uncharacterized protein n=1 Tax=Gossypium barbadense TaxID=3634 RepID=A0A2P5YVQ6_GOSBA|nr:hypothetical protein GOBAR_AA00906 [Gossypium barbadense]